MLSLQGNVNRQSYLGTFRSICLSHTLILFFYFLKKKIEIVLSLEMRDIYNICIASYQVELI